MSWKKGGLYWNTKRLSFLCLCQFVSSLLYSGTNVTVPEAVVESAVRKLLSFSFHHPVHSLTPQLFPEQDLPLTAAVVLLPASQLKLASEFIQYLYDEFIPVRSCDSVQSNPDTRLIRTPHYYGQFLFLDPGQKKSPTQPFLVSSCNTPPYMGDQETRPIANTFSLKYTRLYRHVNTDNGQFSRPKD